MTSKAFWKSLLSNRLEDLLHRDVDFAVRMARPDLGALFDRRVGTIRLTFYGHRAHLRKHGVPRGDGRPAEPYPDRL